MKNIKVTLRKRKIKHGRISLYLDFYPPLFDPENASNKRREYLGFHIYSQPKSPAEKEYNRVCMIKAESIRSQREIEFLNYGFGFYHKQNEKKDFLAYFLAKTKNRSESDGNRGNWKSTFEHFKNYCGGRCTFGDLSSAFCLGFRDYLKSTKSIKRNHTLSANSQLSYFTKFRTAIKEAVREGSTA